METEHDDPATGHVLAAVVADPLGHGQRAGVAHAEPFADDAAQEELPGGGAVADHVPGDNLLVGGEVRLRVGRDDDPAAGQPLAR